MANADGVGPEEKAPSSNSTNPNSSTSNQESTMTEIAKQDIPSGSSPFDRIRRVDENGVEYWDAREMMPLLGYARYNEFAASIARAKRSAEAHGLEVDANFRRLPDNSQVGKRGPKAWTEHFSRRAAYLVAMNCYPSKPEVAAAQNYFAERTRESEVRPQSSAAEIGQEIAKSLRPILEGLQKADTRAATDIASLNGRVTEIERELRVRQPLTARHSITLETIFGYCQRVGIPTNALTRASHTTRIKSAIAKAGLKIEPVKKKVDGKGGYPVSHWPTWILERYFRHPKNRDYGINDRQTIEPILEPSGPELYCEE